MATTTTTAGEIYNVGTDRERSVRDVAGDIAKYFGLPEDKVVNVKDRAFNDRCVPFPRHGCAWVGGPGRGAGRVRGGVARATEAHSTACC